MLCDGMTSSAHRLLALAALAAVGGVATAQAVAATGGAKAGAGRAAEARGEVARATRGGVARGEAARARAVAAKKRAKAKARAVKLSGDVAWVPASALLAERAPLTGATGGGASGPGGSGGAGSGAGGSGSGGTGGTGTGGTPTTTTPDTPTQQQALGATVDERTGYTMVLSRTTLAAGSVVVQLINKGEDPHNLRIVRTSPSGGAATDLPETGPQQQSSKTVTLTSGTYYLYCTLQQPTSHEAAGMHATLRVDP